MVVFNELMNGLYRQDFMKIDVHLITAGFEVVSSAKKGFMYSTLNMNISARILYICLFAFTQVSKLSNSREQKILKTCIK